MTKIIGAIMILLSFYLIIRGAKKEWKYSRTLGLNLISAGVLLIILGVSLLFTALSICEIFTFLC